MPSKYRSDYVDVDLRIRDIEGRITDLEVMCAGLARGLHEVRELVLLIERRGSDDDACAT